MKIRRTFTAKQKADIVLSVIKNEESAVNIGRDNKITPSLIYRWKDEFIQKSGRVFESNTVENEKDRKIKKYETVIAKLTTQNDFLDKVLEHLK